MLIKVTSVSDVEQVRKGKNKWNSIAITYLDEKSGNKEFTKKIADFADKDVFAAAEDMEVDKFYEVEIKKEGDYWNWKSITPSDAASFGGGNKSAGASSSKPSGGNGGADWGAKNALDRERFEFEKEKQALIIRQSCIGYAIQAAGPNSTFEQIRGVAERFEQWVWEANDVDPGMSLGGGTEGMPD